jgi:3-oxoadipate enol-lactonase
MPTARINAVDLYYETHGEGQPLLLITGLGSGVRLFMKSIPVFSNDRKVVAFDNRGAGRSDKPDIPYTIEMMADDAAGLLDAIGVERADVLGVSMGGRIAMDLAIRHPELVRGLILVSTTARVTREARASPTLRVGRLVKRITGRGASYRGFKHQFDASTNFDCTARLGTIVAPTLIMRGDRDTIASRDLVEELHAGIKGSRLVVFKGGHLFFVWDNKGFTEAASGFLREVG